MPVSESVQVVPLDAAPPGGSSLSAAALAEYEAALAHHEQHAALAKDDRDRFLAYSNQGLLLANMGRTEEAVQMRKVRTRAFLSKSVPVCIFVHSKQQNSGVGDRPADASGAE